MMRAMEITTRIGCKNMCQYCPQLLIIKKYFGKKSQPVVDSLRFFDASVKRIK